MGEHPLPPTATCKGVASVLVAHFRLYGAVKANVRSLDRSTYEAYSVLPVDWSDLDTRDMPKPCWKLGGAGGREGPRPGKRSGSTAVCVG